MYIIIEAVAQAQLRTYEKIKNFMTGSERSLDRSFSYVAGHKDYPQDCKCTLKGIAYPSECTFVMHYHT